MRNSIKLLSIWGVVFSMFLFVSCNSDDDSTDNPSGSTINIEEAKLSNFPLFGISAKSINIIDPEIVDNKEVKYGEIKITVSRETSLDKISALITSEELNLSKFSVSPGNDIQLSFEDEKIQVYTISSTVGDKEELLHYNVSIIKEAPPVEPETLKITDFTFEKSKNPDLPNDITISRTIEESGRDILYVFVPLGTNFKDLVPTIAYDGAKLFYTQDSSTLPDDITTEFPTTDTSIDFEYPKSFILLVRNDNDFRTTQVIVDVINPIRIEQASITTPDVTEGTTGNFTGVTKWINQGNHPIVYQKATTYENDEPSTPTRVITARRVLPPVRLNPGESADVNVRVNPTRAYPENTYKTTAVFYSRIQFHQGVDDLLEPAKLSITSKIIK